MWKKFWGWYERHYKLNLAIAAGLFTLQLVHLFWLATHVIWLKLFGYSLFNPGPLAETVIILVDYTEIPALITTSMVYLNELRKKVSVKNIWFLFSLWIQLVHMFWITDEFVIEKFTSPVGMPLWLAWIAILIDYLELPIIIQTLKLFFTEIKNKDLQSALKTLKD